MEQNKETHHYIIAAPCILNNGSKIITYLKDQGKGKYWTNKRSEAKVFMCIEHAQNRLSKIQFRDPYLIEVT